MMNFMLPHHMAALRLIMQEIAIAVPRLNADSDAVAGPKDRERIKANLVFPMRKAQEYGFETVQNRIERIETALRLNNPLPLSEIVRQIQSLLEAYEDDTKFLYLYAYPKDKVQRYLRAQAEWAPAFKAMPAIGDDLDRATDLYALGHNLASVFHLMRIMEMGVQRFGRRLGVQPSILTPTKLADRSWGQILNDLNGPLKALPQDTPARKAKFEKYSAIQSYLYNVKDAWRNPTMHPRRTGYNDQEALDILNHVRSFMNELASALSR